jgi:hypothetical protein
MVPECSTLPPECKVGTKNAEELPGREARERKETVVPTKQDYTLYIPTKRDLFSCRWF